MAHKVIIVADAPVAPLKKSLAGLNMTVKEDCCWNGNCCHGVEYCCNECDGTCTCSKGGKCSQKAAQKRVAKGSCFFIVVVRYAVVVVAVVVAVVVIAVVVIVAVVIVAVVVVVVAVVVVVVVVAVVVIGF